eukprot:349282-Rhodomonas_salina.1
MPSAAGASSHDRGRAVQVCASCWTPRRGVILCIAPVQAVLLSSPATRWCCAADNQAACAPGGRERLSRRKVRSRWLPDPFAMECPVLRRVVRRPGGFYFVSFPNEGGLKPQE